MNKYQTMDEFYKACGDAIRSKKNNAEQVERINIPEEILSIPTNEALVVDSLDESLLIKENVGKLYECGGKLYRIVGDASSITSLQGATIEFNEKLTPPNIYAYYSDKGTCYINNKIFVNLMFSYSNDPEYGDIFSLNIDNDIDASYGYDIYTPDFDTDMDYWYKDGIDGYSPCPTPIITGFDFPDLNENQDFVQWVLENAEVIKYEFKELIVPMGEMITELSSLDKELLIEGNINKLYKNTLYILKARRYLLLFS